MITPKEYYSSRMDSLAARIAIHRRRNRLFVGGEIASFALFIAFIFAYAQLEWGSMGVWAAVLSICCDTPHGRAKRGPDRVA